MNVFLLHSRREVNIGITLLSIGLAILFVMVGVSKLTSQPETVADFARWNYPDWFRMTVGLVEVIGAVTLLIPIVAPQMLRPTLFGLTALCVVLIGALYTTVSAGEMSRVAFTSVVLVFTLLVGVIRQRQEMTRMKAVN